MIAYICKFIIIILIISPVYLLLRRPWKCWNKREGALAVFILFTVALLALAFEGNYNAPSVMIEDMRYRVIAGEKINLVPFRTIGTFFRHFIPEVFLINIVGNIVMFMPWGFGLVSLNDSMFYETQLQVEFFLKEQPVEYGISQYSLL